MPFEQPTYDEQNRNRRGHTMRFQNDTRLELGTWSKAHDFPPRVGIFVEGGKVSISPRIIFEHLFMVARTGAGKTTALLAIIAQIADKTDWDIIFIDGKGDVGTAQKVRGLLYQYGRLAPIVQVATGHAGALYDGFRGDADSIENRLIAASQIDQYDGKALFYSSVYKNGIQLVCIPDPPRSFAELRPRLTPDWLRKTHGAHDPAVMALTNSKGSQTTPIENLALLLMPTIRRLERIVRPGGHALEDGSMIFSLCTPNAKDTVHATFGWICEDIKSYLSTRKRPERRLVIIVDEFGELQNTTFHEITSMARSFGVGAIIATQSLASLGNTLAQEALIANTTTVICLNTQFPEFIAKLAGTKERAEHSMQHKEGEATEFGSVRLQQAWNIDPNHIAQLATGEAFIIRNRLNARFQFDVTPDAPPAPPEPPPPPLPRPEPQGPSTVLEL